MFQLLSQVLCCDDVQETALPHVRSGEEAGKVPDCLHLSHAQVPPEDRHSEVSTFSARRNARERPGHDDLLESGPSHRGPLGDQHQGGHPGPGTGGNVYEVSYPGSVISISCNFCFYFFCISFCFISASYFKQLTRQRDHEQDQGKEKGDIYRT